MISNIALLIVK